MTRETKGRAHYSPRWGVDTKSCNVPKEKPRQDKAEVETQTKRTHPTEECQGE